MAVMPYTSYCRCDVAQHRLVGRPSPAPSDEANRLLKVFELINAFVSERPDVAPSGVPSGLRMTAHRFALVAISRCHAIARLRRILGRTGTRACFNGRKMVIRGGFRQSHAVTSQEFAFIGFDSAASTIPSFARIGGVVSSGRRPSDRSTCNRLRRLHHRFSLISLVSGWAFSVYNVERT
jgi:hypothetical protein